MSASKPTQLRRSPVDDVAQPPPLDERQQRQQVEVAGRVDAKTLAGDLASRQRRRPVGGDQRGHHRADAGAADVVDLDAALLQRAIDAEVGKAARAAAGQHQADGACDSRCAPAAPCRDRARGGCARGRSPRGVQATPACPLRAAAFRADAAAPGSRRPRLRPAVPHQVFGFGRRAAPAAASRRPAAATSSEPRQQRCVQGVGVSSPSSSTNSCAASISSSAAAPAGRRRRHRCSSRDAAVGEIVVDRRCIDDADPADCASCAASRCANGPASTPPEIGSRPIVTGRAARRSALRLQTLDDLPRQRDGQLRARRQQAVEVGLAQPHQHRVADGHHGRRRGSPVMTLISPTIWPRPISRTARGVPSSSVHVRAQPAAQHEVHRVAGLALCHQRARRGRPSTPDTRATRSSAAGFDVAEIAFEGRGRGVPS